jgi:hypothetical protein
LELLLAEMEGRSRGPRGRFDFKEILRPTALPALDCFGTEEHVREIAGRIVIHKVGHRLTHERWEACLAAQLARPIVHSERRNLLGEQVIDLLSSIKHKINESVGRRKKTHTSLAQEPIA